MAERKMGRGRAPCCDKTKVRTGPWSPAEDARLMNYIQKHGHSNWRALPKQAGLLRCGKSCRLRWINYLRPDVKRGNFTPEEERTIIELQNSIGNKWSRIASCLPGRTDNEIKNVWNTHLKKRVQLMTMTSKSTLDSNSSASSTSSSSCTSSSIGDENMEKLFDDAKPSSLTGHASDHHNNEELFLDSPISSCCLTNFSDSRKEDSSACEFVYSNSTREVTTTDPDDLLAAVASEFDIDFWESLDALESEQKKNMGEVEFGKWLKFWENELGELTSTGDDHHHNIMDLTPNNA